MPTTMTAASILCETTSLLKKVDNGLHHRFGVIFTLVMMIFLVQRSLS